MSNSIDENKNFTLGIAYSYKCNIRCRHCIVNASPEASERMLLSEVKGIINEANAIGIGRISIVGGEPFLFYDDLRALIEHASSFDLPCSVVTNGFWAKTPFSARKALVSLRKAGLRFLSVSTDRYHREFIEIDYVLNAIIEAQRLGIKLRVLTCYDCDEEITDFLRRRFPQIHIQRRCLRAGGRAVHLKKKRADRFRPASGLSVSCLLSLHSPIITPHGDLIACCDGALTFPHPNPFCKGNIKRTALKELFRRFKSDLLWRVLRVMGARGPLFFCAQDERGIPEINPDPWDTCALCRELWGKRNGNFYRLWKNVERNNRHIRRQIASYEMAGEDFFLDQFKGGFYDHYDSGTGAQ